MIEILHALQAVHEQMQSCEAGMKNLVMIQASLIYDMNISSSNSKQWNTIKIIYIALKYSLDI